MENMEFHFLTSYSKRQNISFYSVLASDVPITLNNIFSALKSVFRGGGKFKMYVIMGTYAPYYKRVEIYLHNNYRVKEPEPCLINTIEHECLHHCFEWVSSDLNTEKNIYFSQKVFHE